MVRIYHSIYVLALIASAGVYATALDAEAELELATSTCGSSTSSVS